MNRSRHAAGRIAELVKAVESIARRNYEQGWRDCYEDGRRSPVPPSREPKLRGVAGGRKGGADD